MYSISARLRSSGKLRAESMAVVLDEIGRLIPGQEQRHELLQLVVILARGFSGPAPAAPATAGSLFSCFSCLQQA